MPTLATTCIGKYFRTTVLRKVRKLPWLSKNDEIERIFEDNKVIVKEGKKNG